MRIWTFRVITLLAALLLALALGEVVCRLLISQPSRARVPNERHTSPPGAPDFRGRVFEWSKDRGTFRILVVGDSYTWGWGVRPGETYSARLQRFLERLDLGVPVEVVTWSRPGWNTAGEWRSLEPHLAQLAPDLLLLGYCLNDVEPIDEGRRALLLATRRRVPEGPKWFGLYHRSRLYGAIFDTFENRRLRRSLNTYYHALYEGDESRLMGWPLRKFADLARHVPTVLIIFPIFDSELDHRYPYRDLHLVVGERARTLDLPTLDLLPVFLGRDGRKMALAPFTDPHPSPLAHRLAARAILKHLREHRLLPEVEKTGIRLSSTDNPLATRARRDP